MIMTLKEEIIAFSRLFLSRSFLTFLIIGVINTLVGLGTAFFCLNVLGFGYWVSSAMDYVVGSVVSYFLNKRFTFHYQQTDLRSIARFVLNIVICYVIAYSLARPCAQWLLEQMHFNLSTTIIENVAMLVGTVLFTIINYLGQKFFAFKTKD